MRLKRSLVNWPAVILAFGFLTLAGNPSHAVRNQTSLQPAVIATVDLERVFNQLDEREHADEELQRRTEELRERVEQLAGEVEALEEERELLPEGSDEQHELLREIGRRGAQYRAHAEFARRRINAEKSMMLRSIYYSIKEAVAEEAEERGYDLVLVNDSLADLAPGDEAETIRQISSRRVLYSNPDIDISENIIQRMNADFRAERNE